MGQRHPSRPNVTGAIGSGQAKAVEGTLSRLPDHRGVESFGLRLGDAPRNPELAASVWSHGFMRRLGGRWPVSLLGLALAGGILAWPLRAAPPPAGEYQLKAVFLFNFVQFVEWPASAFADPKVPIIFGIVGPDPFGAMLDRTIKGEKVNGRPLEVRRLKPDDDLSACHVVFLSRSKKEDAAELVQKLQGRPVLTVGESEGFAELGGVINFVMADRKVRFEVNPQAAARQGVKISSKLLQLGRVVEAAPQKP